MKRLLLNVLGAFLFFVLVTVAIAAVRTYPEGRVETRNTDIVQVSDLVKVDSTLTTATLTIDFSARPNSNAQNFIIYSQTAGTAVEYAFGGRIRTTCRGSNPVTEIGTGVLKVNVTEPNFSVGDVFEIYDASNSNAVLVKAYVETVNRNPSDYFLIATVIDGEDGESAAASDPIGGPDRYTFDEGSGHLIMGVGQVVVGPTPIYPYLHLRSDSGSPVIRIVQSQ